MPEGHTIRRLATDLTACLGRRPVRVSSPQGRFATEAESLTGEQLVQAESFGKHLFVEFPGDRFIHVHLGLIGTFVVTQLEPDGVVPPAIGAVRLRLQSTRAYADLRGPIVCELVGVDRRTEVIESLGPDPLDPAANLDRAWHKVRRSNRPIGDLLLDQSVCAGVGNVYRAEVLFRQRVHPQRVGRSLQRRQFEAIWRDLVELMAAGVVVNRIDTVRAEHAPEAMGRPPRVDDHGGEVYVYRRAGQPCHVCGRLVKTEPLANRNLFWCPGCQRTPRKS